MKHKEVKKRRKRNLAKVTWKTDNARYVSSSPVSFFFFPYTILSFITVFSARIHEEKY